MKNKAQHWKYAARGLLSLQLSHCFNSDESEAPTSTDSRFDIPSSAFRPSKPKFPDSTKTAKHHDTPSYDSDLFGLLSMMSLADIAQSFQTVSNSGVLHLTSPDGSAEVVFQDGEIVHAESGQQQGEEVFFQLLRWKEGIFRFDRGSHGIPRTIFRSSLSLLIDGARQADESMRAE